jgi:trimeric autotransporter adhesin
MARTTFSGPVASQNGFISVASTSGKLLTINAPAALSADTTLVFPNGAGTNGQVLTTNGTGTLSWTTNGAGTVTSVGGTGTVNGLTLTGTVTSSGSLTLGGNFALPAVTVAELEDETDAINTTGKYIGKMVVTLVDGLIFTASGPGVNDVWYASDGTTDATPV